MVTSTSLLSKTGMFHWEFVPPSSLFILSGALFSWVHGYLGDPTNYIHIVHKVCQCCLMDRQQMQRQLDLP